MDTVGWWRKQLEVPDRTEWHVGHELGRGTSDGTYEYGELTVRVPDDSISCIVVSPLGARWQGPVVLVPFYRVSYVTGRGDLDRYGSADAAWRKAFASHLADRGMTAVAVPWWFESIVDECANDLAGRYRPAVAEHFRRHACTGLGRSIADLVAVLDALDDVAGSGSQYGCFGHSLGGKLALFLAALDDRIAAAVSSEPGLGWAHSNWSDPWYVDERIPERDQDELLAAIPPRRFLLITGGASDGAHNAELITSARERAGAKAGRIEVFRHEEGHGTQLWVLDEAYGWLQGALA